MGIGRIKRHARPTCGADVDVAATREDDRLAPASIYAATKAALGGFAQSLRLDLSPSGVRVTEIVAGRVETGLYKGLLSAEARAEMAGARAEMAGARGSAAMERDAAAVELQRFLGELGYA